MNLIPSRQITLYARGSYSHGMIRDTVTGCLYPKLFIAFNTLKESEEREIVALIALSLEEGDLQQETIVRIVEENVARFKGLPSWFR